MPVKNKTSPQKQKSFEETLWETANKLREFIKTHVKYGDDGETMFRIRDGRIRPSKGLADHLASMIQGNPEFYLIDEQKLVYETAILLAEVSKTWENKGVKRKR